MARTPKRRYIQKPQGMVAPRVLSTADQIAPYYGGRAALESGISDAQDLARQLSVLDEIDQTGYRKMFPEIDYSRYGDDLAVLPTREGDQSGVVNTPQSVDELGNLIQMQSGEVVPAPDLATEMPSIAFGSDPLEYDEVPVAFGTTPLPPDSAKALIKDAPFASQRAQSVEMPMTEYVTGSDFSFDPMRSPADDPRPMGSAIDQVLAQIRRASGKNYLDVPEARALLQDAVSRSDVPDRLLDLGPSEVPIDAQTGLPLEVLRRLGELPPEMHPFLTKRIRELLTLGGVTTGLMSAGGERNQPSGGMRTNATTGPLSGLMQ